MFGLTLGLDKKTQKGSATTNTSKNETTNQAKTEAQSQTQIGSSASTQNTTSGSKGTSDTVSFGSNTQVGTTGQSSSTSTSLFGDLTLETLDSAVRDMIGSVTAGNAALGGAAGGLAFDIDKFVAQGMTGARDTAMMDLESGLNDMLSNVGSAEGNNSMAMLLGNRMRNATSASLAGTEANLTAQGNQIAAGNVAAQTGAQQQGMALLTGLLDALKGGRSTATGTGASTTSQSGSQQQTGSTSTAESNTSSTAQTTQSMQQLASMLTSLLSGESSMTGTENQTTKGSSTGFNAGLSLK